MKSSSVALYFYYWTNK